jgi:hypothetical protein
MGFHPAPDLPAYPPPFAWFPIPVIRVSPSINIPVSKRKDSAWPTLIAYQNLFVLSSPLSLARHSLACLG